MANMSKSKQLLVRTALVTASTVATLIGAQTLALTNLRPAVTTVQASDTAQTVVTSLKTTTTITHVAPTIVVLSGGNQQTVNSQVTTNSAIAEGSTNLVSYDVLDGVVPAALSLTVTGDVTVAQGGMINADGRGYGVLLRSHLCAV